MIGERANLVSVIRIDGKSGITNSEVIIRINAAPPVEPPQLDVTETEKREIGARLLELAAEIEGFLGEYPLPMLRAMELSGTTDIRAVRKWREEWDARLAARYCYEIRPKVGALYIHARVRGFFDPELEDYYSSSLLAGARGIPALLRKVASSR